MRIEAINNGWLVFVGQDQYLGSAKNYTQFCGTKEEVITAISNNLKTKEELDAIWKKEEEERQKLYATARLTPVNPAY